MIAALVIMAGLLSTAAAADPAGREQAVDSARDALDKSWAGYPWYDAQTDDVRPVAPPEPPPDRDPGRDINLSPIAGMVEGVAYLFLAAIVALIVYLIVRAVMLGLGKKKEKQKKPKSHDDLRRIEALPLPLADLPPDLFDAIRQAAAAGDLRRAIVLLYSYQLVRLDQHRLIHLTRGKTNRQYLRELGRQSPLHAMLEQSMVVFEDVYFGDHAITAERFDACYASLDRFNALLQGGTAA